MNEIVIWGPLWIATVLGQWAGLPGSPLSGAPVQQYVCAQVVMGAETGATAVEVLPDWECGAPMVPEKPHKTAKKRK